MSTMTETLSTAYSSHIFNTAADINPQLKAFEERKGESFVYETLRPLVHKYGLEEVFGVGLLHRHFSVDSNEKLVENGNITSPWKNVQVGLNPFLGRDVHLIYETSWMLDPDTKKWMAYEFGFSPVQGWDLGWDKKCVKLDDPKYADFLREYSNIITENGWEQLLGLQAWPGKDFSGSLEFTNGRSNITIENGVYERPQEGSEWGLAVTNWYFPIGSTQLAECKKCAKECILGRHGGHVGRGPHR